jgi:hypothetical protein
VAQARAQSVARAAPGGSADVRSRAGATSTGKPASADVAGVGTAGPGQTANVDCSLAAKDERIAKLCQNQGQGQTEQTSGGGGGGDATGTGGRGGGGGGSGSNATANAAAQAAAQAGAEAGAAAGAEAGAAAGGAAGAAAAGGGASWESAPNCTADASNPATYIAYDTIGRPWGFENNGSCAYRWVRAGGCCQPAGDFGQLCPSVGWSMSHHGSIPWDRAHLCAGPFRGRAQAFWHADGHSRSRRQPCVYSPSVPCVDRVHPSRNAPTRPRRNAPVKPPAASPEAGNATTAGNPEGPAPTPVPVQAAANTQAAAQAAGSGKQGGGGGSKQGGATAGSPAPASPEPAASPESAASPSPAPAATAAPAPLAAQAQAQAQAQAAAGAGARK